MFLLIDRGTQIDRDAISTNWIASEIEAASVREVALGSESEIRLELQEIARKTKTTYLEKLKKLTAYDEYRRFQIYDLGELVSRTGLKDDPEIQREIAKKTALFFQ